MGNFSLVSNLCLHQACTTANSPSTATGVAAQLGVGKDRQWHSGISTSASVLFLFNQIRVRAHSTQHTPTQSTKHKHMKYKNNALTKHTQTHKAHNTGMRNTFSQFIKRHCPNFSFPDDYDGILAGAPAIHFEKLGLGQTWPQIPMLMENNGKAVPVYGSYARVGGCWCRTPHPASRTHSSVVVNVFCLSLSICWLLLAFTRGYCCESSS